MRFGRRSKDEDRDEDHGEGRGETSEDAPGDIPGDPVADGVVAASAGGPWDASQIEIPSDDSSYIDLGGLIVKGRAGLEVQIPTDRDSNAPRAVVLATEDSVVEILAFAASRSAGLWDDVRAEIITEVERLQGEAEEVAGQFGTELHVQVAVQTPDGKPATQPSRIIGVDGPRWLLRATFMGREALEPAADGVLEQALRDIVVVRGKEPMAPREQIDIVLPDGAVPVADDDSDA